MYSTNMHSKTSPKQLEGFPKPNSDPKCSILAPTRPNESNSKGTGAFESGILSMDECEF
jgi:hypothetical protein